MGQDWAVLSHSLGKPVIAPSVGCYPDVIPAGPGLLYAPESEEEFISALLRSPELENPSIGTNCLDLASKHDWNAVSDATLTLYRSLLDK